MRMNLWPRLWKQVKIRLHLYLGPLTNIAIFLSISHLKSKIERISLMGGSAIGGNWTASAEFNILVDPRAADIVFQIRNTNNYVGVRCYTQLLGFIQTI